MSAIVMAVGLVDLKWRILRAGIGLKNSFLYFDTSKIIPMK